MATVPSVSTFPAGAVLQQTDLINIENACNFLLQKPMVKIIDTIGGVVIGPVGSPVNVSYDTPLFDTDGLWSPSVIAEDQPSNVAITSGATSLIATWAANPTVGSKVLVAVAQNGTTAPTSVVDNGSPQTTFTLDSSNTGNTSQGIYIYRGDNVSPTSSAYTVTVTFNGSHKATVMGQSYTGLQPGGPVSSGTNSSAASTAVSTSSVAIGATKSLFFAAFQDKSALNPETITLTNASFNTILTNTNGAGGQPATCVDNIINGSASQNCTWTLGDSVGWNAAMVEYVAAGSFFLTIQTSGWYKVRYGTAIKNAAGGNYNSYVSTFLGPNNPGNNIGPAGSTSPPFYGSYATNSTTFLVAGAAGIIPYYLYAGDTVFTQVVAGNQSGGTTTVAGFNGSNNTGSYLSLEYVSTS